MQEGQVTSFHICWSRWSTSSVFEVANIGQVRQESLPEISLLFHSRTQVCPTLQAQPKLDSRFVPMSVSGTNIHPAPGDHLCHLSLPHPERSITTSHSLLSCLSLKPVLHHPPGPRFSTGDSFSPQRTFGMMVGLLLEPGVQGPGWGKHPTMYRVALIMAAHIQPRVPMMLRLRNTSLDHVTIISAWTSSRVSQLGFPGTLAPTV